MKKLIDILNYLSEQFEKWFSCIVFFGGIYSAGVLLKDGHKVLAILQVIVLLLYALNNYDSKK